MIREFTVPASVQDLNDAMKVNDVMPEEIIAIFQVDKPSGQGVLMKTQFRVLYDNETLFRRVAHDDG